eukprot:TRINITY_DN7724_c0_g1_i1.p1 TRINITY_DN7724_c0_g1~~TRINITY_DN7724_c0_g1_i1.p1  ORF type:complete len:365 (+),score=78.65 TRINITY_DN7724_c0_g1_i1:45-1139(+)
MSKLIWNQLKVSGYLDTRCAGVTIYSEDHKKIFYFGGKNEEERQSDICFLDLNTNHVHRCAFMKKVRSGASAVLDGNFIYVYGGIDNEDQLNDTLERYDIENNTTRIIENIEADENGEKPTKCIFTMSFLYKKTFYLYGYVERVGSTLWKMDISLPMFQWKKLTVKGPGEDGVSMCRSTQFEHIFYFYGGFVDEGDTFRKELWKFDCLEEKFEKMPLMNGLDSCFGTLVNLDNYLYLYPGVYYRNEKWKRYKEVYRYDLLDKNGEFVLMETGGMDQMKLSQHHSCLVGSRLYVAGGFDGYVRSSTFRYIDLPVRNWSPERHHIFNKDQKSLVLFLVKCYHMKKGLFSNVFVPRRLYYHILGKFI